MEFIVKELEEAQELLLNQISEPSFESVNLIESAGRIAAQDIFAGINVPSFRRSPLDGYALRSEDTRGANPKSPVFIKVIDEVRAGDTREGLSLPCGSAVKIMTGAPMPLNADTVIKKEDVRVIDPSTIEVAMQLFPGLNVIEEGADIRASEKIVSAGEQLTPYHIGALAAGGIAEVQVYKVPRIAVISSGEEVRSPGQPLSYGQIYNSNLYALVALINGLGAEGYGLGCVTDKEEDIAQAIQDALAGYDLVITTGGVSVGDYDLMLKAIQNIKASVLFSRIKMKPGTPTTAAVKDGKLIICLSGNPAAALIGFELLVKKLIKKMRRETSTSLPVIIGKLLDGFDKKSPQRRFLRVKLAYEEKTGWAARQTGSQDSSVLKSMIGCNALVDIPAGSGTIAPGADVKILPLFELP
ncbi:MAG: gephyrin-like molybdotransferase Glp [Bacillota bacterium]